MKKEQIIEHYAGHWQDFFRHHVPELRERGKEAQGNCPLCGEQKGHFYASIEDGLFDCKKCGEKGDPFTFYARLHDLNCQTDFPQVLQGMSEDSGVTPISGPKRAPRKAQEQATLTDVQKITAATVRWFAEHGRSFSLEIWGHFGEVRGRNTAIVLFLVEVNKA